MTVAQLEQVVAFLERDRAGRWHVHDLGLGKFHVGGQARRPLQAIAFAEGSVPAGEWRVGPMAVEELERCVKSVP